MSQPHNTKIQRAQAAAGKAAAWFGNAWSFITMHFKEQKNLVDGKSRAVRALTFLSIVGAVVSCATSLNYTVPVTAEVVNNWFGVGPTAQAVTVSIVICFGYLIEGGMMIMVPFGLSLVAAVITQQTNAVREFAQIPDTGGKWFGRWIVGIFQNLIGFVGFLFALIRFKASAVIAVAVLVIGLGQATMSMYFSWNGNDWKATEIAGDLRPANSKADVLGATDTLRRKSKNDIIAFYKNEIAEAAKTNKDDKKKAKAAAATEAAKTRAIVYKQYGADLARGNGWAKTKVAEAEAVIAADSTAKISALDLAVITTKLKAKRDAEISGDSLSFATLSGAKVADVEDGTARFTGKRNAIAMLWQWLGVIATPFFFLCCLISALIKVVDFQALTNAVGAAVAANNNNAATAGAGSGNRNNPLPQGNGGAGGSGAGGAGAGQNIKQIKIRDHKNRTLGEVGSDIADAFNRMNIAVENGNNASAKTNALNCCQELADYLSHPEHADPTSAMAALDAKYKTLKANALNKGWKIYTENDIYNLAHS